MNKGYIKIAEIESYPYLWSVRYCFVEAALGKKLQLVMPMLGNELEEMYTIFHIKRVPVSRGTHVKQYVNG